MLPQLLVFTRQSFTVDVMMKHKNRTTLSYLLRPTWKPCEFRRAMPMNGLELGGHIVTGHIDAIE